MKKLSLRIRYTLMTSLFLLISCTALTIISNLSANSVMQAITLSPSVEIGESAQQSPDSSPETSREPEHISEPAVITTRASYRVFRRESIIATVLIVLIGSAATYAAAGYVLKPIVSLSREVKKRDANNFAQALPLPSSADEVQELTASFNALLAEVKRSFQLQKQFSSDAAHELRTPLAVMQTKLDVFSMSGDLPPEAQEFAKNLQAQLARLSSLVEDLLWFSRDYPLEPVEPVRLLPLLQDIVEELFDAAREKGIRVELHASDCVVQGQDCLLERAFYNLLENAIKYSPDGTVVELSAAVQEGAAVVRVADQGEGIPEKYREEIFEPFFRVEKSRNRAVGGSGLGLAVCKKILERHRAVIRVLPRHPCGSVFEVTFPS